MTAAVTPRTRTVRVIDIADNATVRKLCGGVTRHTLIRWRKDRGFPEPLPTRKGVPDLWDVREVRAWLATREDGA